MQKAAGLGVSAQFLQTASLFMVHHGCADISIFICEKSGCHLILGRTTGSQTEIT
jgi:hypothetical protein